MQFFSFWHAFRILLNNETKLQTLAGNHQFHYLTGKRKILNVTLNVINFLQKFNCSNREFSNFSS